MEVTISKKQPQRRLVAVIGQDGGVWFRAETGGSVYIGPLTGRVETRISSAIESLIEPTNDHSKDRQAIYEGDEITIIF